MTEKELLDKIDELTIANAKLNLEIDILKNKNKELKEHNDKLIHCNDVYHRFIGEYNNG